MTCIIKIDLIYIPGLSVAASCHCMLSECFLYKPSFRVARISTGIAPCTELLDVLYVLQSHVLTGGILCVQAYNLSSCIVMIS